VGTEGYPRVMPMTTAIAPEFARRRSSTTLHMMHDIISDIVASADIPRDRKRSAIERQLAEFRSSRSHTLSPEEWRAMADHMGGAAAMGWPALMGPAPADSTPAAPAEPPHHHH